MASSNNLKDIFERIVETSDDFSMARLHENTWSLIEEIQEIKNIIPYLKENFGKKYRDLSYSLLRNSFLIELVKIPKIETTKFRVRWVEQLNGDPRGCSFEECLQIAIELIKTLPEWIKTPGHSESLDLSLDCNIIPYEAPIDYAVRETANHRLHTLGNIIWFYDELIIRTLRLRKYLTDSNSSPDASFFKKVLTDKIKVKTYLTDRVLTGEHKTNREKRWETHPNSVHFAERRTCLAIEYALITQLCAFEGFPKKALDNLVKAKILPKKLNTALCPITGDSLSYEAFRDELLDPTHGKSDFQVGHLNPLKLNSSDDIATGHTAENISWISADGNRIQGSLSLDEVRHLIIRIAKNYKRHHWMPK